MTKFACVEVAYHGANGGERTGYEPEFDTLEEAQAFKDKNETLTRDSSGVGSGTEYYIKQIELAPNGDEIFGEDFEAI